MSIQAFVCLWLNDWAGHTVDINAAVLATNLTDGAHGPHVAFISWAVLGWGQQRFGVEESFGVQGIQASIDWNLTHRTQVTVAPDLQFGGVLRRNPDTGTTGMQLHTKLSLNLINIVIVFGSEQWSSPMPQMQNSFNMHIVIYQSTQSFGLQILIFSCSTITTVFIHCFYYIVLSIRIKHSIFFTKIYVFLLL